MIPVCKDSIGLTLCRTCRKYAQKIVLLNSMENILIFMCPFLLLLSGEAEPALIQIQRSSSHIFFLASSHGKHSGLSLSCSCDGLLGRLEMFLISVDLATLIKCMNNLQRPENHNQYISLPRYSIMLKAVTIC